MKEYSSKYSDSAFKIEDTISAIVKDSKKANISETVGETRTKLSGFLEVIPSIPCAKYGGDLMTQFLGKEWES